MRVIKAVQQRYTPSPESLQLLDQFRQMVNDCIRIGIAENITSRQALSLKAYHQLDRYSLPTIYRLTAMSAATGIIRNYRKILKKNSNARTPYAKKLTLIDCYGFKVENGQLRLTIKPYRYMYIPLNEHALQAISGHIVRSITLTTRTLSISYSKETAEIEPTGYIGIDRNLNNVTTADSTGEIEQLDLSEATRVKAQCRETKWHMTRNDVRIRRQVYGKYGRKQRNKVQQILHHASKQIVEQAKGNQHGIVMENLKNIRRLYRKGNWQGKKYRNTMNGWSFAELQRQIEYKAQWEGLRVIYVYPAGTSVKCSKCGSRMARIPEENRQLKCPSCGYTVDRDVNAARNILARGLRFKPVASASEAMVQEPHEGSPPEVILKVDVDELTPKLRS